MVSTRIRYRVWKHRVLVSLSETYGLFEIEYDYRDLYLQGYSSRQAARLIAREVS